METPDKQYFRQMVKSNINSTKSGGYYVVMRMALYLCGSPLIFFGIFFPKTHNPNLIMKKMPENPQTDTFYKIPDQDASNFQDHQK